MKKRITYDFNPIMIFDKQPYARFKEGNQRSIPSRAYVVFDFRRHVFNMRPLHTCKLPEKRKIVHCCLNVILCKDIRYRNSASVDVTNDGVRRGKLCIYRVQRVNSKFSNYFVSTIVSKLKCAVEVCS